VNTVMNLRVLQRHAWVTEQLSVSERIRPSQEVPFVFIPRQDYTVSARASLLIAAQRSNASVGGGVNSFQGHRISLHTAPTCFTLSPSSCPLTLTSPFSLQFLAYSLHLQVPIVTKTRNQQEKAEVACFCRLLAQLTLPSSEWRPYPPSKRRTLSELHGITAQSLFILKKKTPWF
jgi:hypothetical protein